MESSGTVRTICEVSCGRTDLSDEELERPLDFRERSEA